MEFLRASVDDMVDGDWGRMKIGREVLGVGWGLTQQFGSEAWGLGDRQ